MIIGVDQLSVRGLICIALLVSGFIFLPQAVTLFAGQHNWYDMASEENILSSDIRCEKCHADIADEMSAHTGPHTGETGYGRMECAQCHRIKLGTYQFAAVGNDSEVFPGEYAHAASTVACMDCHQYVTKEEFETNTVGGDHTAYNGGNNPYRFGPAPDYCRKCHAQGQNKNEGDGSKNQFMAIPSAGGFGLTNGTGDTGNKAAHMSFIRSAMNNSALKGSNEACIGCHTAAPVRIGWSHTANLEFEVKFGEFQDSGWNVTCWETNGTANVTVWGSMSGSGTTNGENWPGNVDNTYKIGITNRH
ncbi:MAG: hypothetical protein R6U44_03210 [Archaeoglobaceae archaeon]